MKVNFRHVWCGVAGKIKCKNNKKMQKIRPEKIGKRKRKKKIERGGGEVGVVD